jgi:hypothetical protein
MGSSNENIATEPKRSNIKISFNITGFRRRGKHLADPNVWSDADRCVLPPHFACLAFDDLYALMRFYCISFLVTLVRTIFQKSH